ncbi:hypothetical protein JAO29_16600 [Edaphobacter sp. HDX4]|uniref:hypothetical protein n=1 Tax=Edaphobacter sp. HDX4 TaxID=2794064 RepID=UPI002FE69101
MGNEPYSLRITGKTSLGPSGTGGADLIESLNADTVRSTLQDLGMTGDVLAAADAVINDPRHADRFISIAEAVQIPFDVLERAHVNLFD